MQKVVERIAVLFAKSKLVGGAIYPPADRTMKLHVFKFQHRFLQHVLPRGLHKVRHHGFLSRRSKLDLDIVRAAILKSMEDSEPDLELIDWHPPILKPRDEKSLTCPTCGSPLEFAGFQRIRPPPLEWRPSSNAKSSLIHSSASDVSF